MMYRSYPAKHFHIWQIHNSVNLASDDKSWIKIMIHFFKYDNCFEQLQCKPCDGYTVF